MPATPLTVPQAGHPLCPACLGGSMERQGRKGHRLRFRCRRCGASRLEGCSGRWPEIRERLARTPAGWLVELRADGYPVSRDVRGRRRAYLGKEHPWANSGGWLYLAQFIVADALGRPLRDGEQVHHRSGDATDDRPENLEAVWIEYHGRLHAWAMDFAGLRGVDGRFAEFEDAADFDSPRRIDRWGAILGHAARACIPRQRRRRGDGGEALGEQARRLAGLVVPTLQGDGDAERLDVRPDARPA